MASSRSFASLLCALLLAFPISATFSFDGGKSAAAGKAVDMEWRPATATWYGEAEGDGSDGGACGYGTLVDVVPMKARVGSVSPVLFKDGEGCGACYKVKCLDHTVCSRRAVTVIVTDECPGGLCAFGRTHFDLSGAAFSRMAVAGAGGHLRDRGEISVVYTRTACKYGGKNIAFHVNEGSTNFWLSLLVEFEDGEGDIGSMQIKQIAAVVSLQLWTATLLRDAGWLKIVTVAYFFGSFLNHNLFLAIHELSHNLAFTTPYLNRWLGIFANLPIGVPMSITFQKYHLEHHRFQGVDGIDMDIPGQAEAHAVKNAISKSVWVVLQLFFYALRPLFLKPKPPGLWEFTNLTIQIALDVSLVYFYGWKSLAYLILSTFVGGGMHPMAGHFISEHYVFNPDQETYSYYGPLNLMAWHVGYHNEHHDFPRIPGTRLHKVKEISPEYYDNLKSYKSWSQVIYMYIMDQTVGPFSRMKRKAPKKDS